MNTQKSEEKFAGLELGGGKSDRTALVCLEFFAQDSRIFLRKVLKNLGATTLGSADEVLIQEMKKAEASIIGVNAPLGFPPYVSCDAKHLVPVELSQDESVVWMIEEAKRSGLASRKLPTPYTQRSLDVYLRTRVQARFEFDLHLEETMGSGRAPLATRMRYILSQAPGIEFHEALPRLALVVLAEWYCIPDRELRRYRDIEEGAGHRLSMLHYLQSDLREKGLPQLFLYDSDMDGLAKDLSVFNALLCGLMAAYYRVGLVESPGSDFQKHWGFMIIPKRPECRT